jgi:hypothetical protein
MLPARRVPHFASLTLASLVFLPGCLSPSGGGDAGDESSTGSTGETPATTGETPTTGDGSDTGAAGCGPCAADEACIGTSCEAVDRPEIERGCNPLGDPGGRGQCLYPWPIDLLTTPDASTPTGLRLDYDATLLPATLEGALFTVDELANTFDGFSPNSQIRFVFAAEVDAAPLPGLHGIADSLAPDAEIVLIDAESGERWPYFVEADATAEAGEPVTMFVRPMKRLDFNRRYVIGLRGLKDKSGATIAPTPLFRALRDQLTTDVPQLEAMRADHEAVFSALQKAGVERGELQLAWGFTTASAERAQRDLTAISPQIEAQAGGGSLGYEIKSIDVDPDPALARVLRGYLTVPNCLTGDAGPGALLQRDPEGMPVCKGTTQAPFVIAIPKEVWDSGSPVPFIVYGHGLLGSGEEAVGIAKKATSVIVAGTDFWGMSQEDIPTLATTLQANFKGAATLADRLLQSAVNFTSLAYLAQGDLMQEMELKSPIDMTQSLIDPTAVHYLGGSQGGIMGGTVVAMAPNLSRGIAVVGAGNYSLMVWRSTAFSMLNSLWEGAQPDTQDREFLLSIFQSTFDRVDPIIHKELLEQPLGGGDPKRLMLVESIGDCQVPNIATEVMARSLGMSMLGPPVEEVWGMSDITGEVTEGSVLLQVDTLKGPRPPENNTPPEDDNGAHGSAIDDPAVVSIVERFIFKGIFENLCDGPCNPG